MFGAFANITSVDRTSELLEALKELSDKQVYIGIPEGADNDRPGSDITNAELMYAHTHGVRSSEMRKEMNNSGQIYGRAYQLFLQSHGSPLWHSPPRPVIEPAIQNSKEILAKQLKKVLTVALNGEDPSQELEKTGMLGQNIARDWFTNPANNWPANAQSTIDAKGSDNPLIDEGELRKSITYVVTGGD